MSEIKLIEIASARSGDKGETANIGVVAYTPEGFELIKKVLTAEQVKEYFYGISPKSVERFILPNILSFNFLLHGALNGGGSRSLRVDAQGKALGQALLQMKLEVPEEKLSKMRKPA